MKAIDKIYSKIMDEGNLDKILQDLKSRNQSIVFTNGCFDILHKGHLEYLATASDLGDCFIIGLNSDQSVRNLKGPDRPAVDQESRAVKLASFEFVDYLVIFEEINPSGLMKKIKPDIWVKGGDYTNLEHLPEYQVMMDIGGEVVILPFVEGYSTTDIYHKILRSAKNQNKD